LQETLARAGVMLTFFNDMDMSPPLSDAVIAAQILGVHGFFEGWDARLEAPLARSMAQHWARRLATVRDVKSDGCNQKMDTYDGAVSRAEFSALLARAGVPLTGNIYNAEETGARTLSCGEAALWVRPFLYV
jgi:hypothetical protein